MQTNISLQRLFTAKLLSTGRQWRRAVDVALSAYGISEACAAPLIWIGRLNGGVRQVVLASHVGIEGPSLVRLLDQLEALGLVTRRDDPDDRRAKGLWLTEAGEALAAEMEDAVDAVRSRILAGIDPADVEAAVRVLGVFENIDFSERAAAGSNSETVS
jgi:MarR family transcriptional regulator for hemolysin